MAYTHFRFFVVLALLSFGPVPLLAKPAVAEAAGQELIHPAVDVDGVRQFAVAHRYTGYRALPPGIRKNLARGKPLPPGIAKKTIPTPLHHELPAYPGYEWKRCGQDLVLIDLATQIVAEVFAAIFK